MLALRRIPVRSIALSCALAVLASACDSSPTAPNDDLDLSSSMALEGGSALLFQDGGRLATHRGKIEQVVKDTITVVRPLIPIDGMTIIAYAGVDLVIPEIGMGGRAEGGTVRLAFDPGSPVLAAALDTELFPLLAHELHHVARMRAIGYGEHLLGAMISEGLADQFSVEVAGIAPPRWAVALDDDALAIFSERARDEWFNTSYDHDAWFFGGGGIPRWAGYSIGFAMTGAYLAVHPELSAARLYAAPATAFVSSPASAPR